MPKYDLFAVGTRWQHRNLGHVVHILDEVSRGKYTIGFAGLDRTAVFSADSLQGYLVEGLWTAETLIRDFDPLDLDSRWNRILENITTLQ